MAEINLFPYTDLLFSNPISRRITSKDCEYPKVDACTVVDAAPQKNVSFFSVQNNLLTDQAFAELFACKMLDTSISSGLEGMASIGEDQSPVMHAMIDADKLMLVSVNAADMRVDMNTIDVENFSHYVASMYSEIENKIFPVISNDVFIAA